MTSNVKLTESDTHIFRYFFDHRMLRIDHLMRLTGRSREALKRRILKLTRSSYLSCKKRPFQKYIYGLGRGALSVLVEQGIAPRERVQQRIRHSELKELFLEHFMMIVDFHVALTIAARSRNLNIVAWRQGDELRDRVKVAAGRTLPVWPDAFFTLEDPSAPANRRFVHYMFEADRSTSGRRFGDKIEAYRHYFEQRLHKRKYGVDTFRVCTLTKTRQRAATLCKLTAELLPKSYRKFYLFTSLEDFLPNYPESLLRPIAITPHDAIPRRLV